MSTTVVTGAGSGVGRAIALKFAGHGWKVALVGRRTDPLVETIALAGAGGANRMAAFRCDVSNWDDVAALVPRRSLDLLSIDDWHEVIATNLHGAYYCVRAFLPGMRERHTGTIVNVNSDVGRMARDLAGAAYVCSKFGLAGLTQQINAEERSHGIRACSIFPRDINTPLLDKRPQPPSPEARAQMMQPEDIAECVWLASTLPSRVVLDEISLSSR
jgi:NAD(P)-dependent dehydrogenase (short-subunit alcohol dehydrogenase family)